MPSTGSPSEVPDTFADFFLNKIKKIREQFENNSAEGKYIRRCPKITGFWPLAKK